VTEDGAVGSADAPLRVALYGEINMNLIDGSSVWVQSAAQTLATLDSVQVTLLLRFPQDRTLTSDRALDVLERLDAERGFDVVLLRGATVTERAAARGAFPGRLWVYYLPVHGYDPELEREHLSSVAAASERVLCQTEAIRALAEAAAPGAAAKLTLLPPMVSEAGGSPARVHEPGRSLRLLYAGKFAPEYDFLEMLETFRLLRQSDPGAELHLVGDKIHDPPDDPGFKAAAEAALAGSEGVVWHGGVTRERVGELLADADVALSVRHPQMTRSMELSTKVLEYGAAGCAVLLNRTPLYEELLGPDYPLFAGDRNEALAVLLEVKDDPAIAKEAAERCRAAAARFSFERVAATLAPHLRAGSAVEGGSAGGVGKLLIAGHDFKFLGQIPERAAALGAEVREDRWTAHDVHDERRSRKLLGWADRILCEWCLGNAVFYSRNVGAGQRLVVRFHRMERETAYPAAVEIEGVDRVVFVGPHLLDEAVERHSWPREKLCVIPNAIDPATLRRPKLPGSGFNLGLIGYVPALKRLDRALDLLELLRARDPRFRLIVKGTHPWELEWLMRREEEWSFFQSQYQRVRSAPLLAEAVSFEPFDPNVPAFLRKIGVIVSTSDWEGHQVALAEAMASGSMPVILDRPGAREQYPDRWVHDSADEAARQVLDVIGAGGMQEEQQLAREFADRWGLEAVMPLWDRVLGLEGDSADPELVPRALGESS
jgi:glycosyltransferase involved in cell wall biosynthesis